MNRIVVPFFYLGTLISSIGSFAFNVSLVAFMLQSGFPLWKASLIIGMNRIVLIIANTFFGHLSDRVSARTVLLITEGIAALATLGLFFVWSEIATNFPLFVILCVTRGAVVSFQTGSRSKLAKIFSDGSFASNKKHAIWLNNATQGATLFGGLVGWAIVSFFDMKTAIIFDGITFFISGLFTFVIPDTVPDPEDLKNRIKWQQKFIDLYRYSREPAFLDIFLAMSMMGTVAFQSRIAGSNQSWIGLFLASFGLAVWVAGFLEQRLTHKIRSFPFWIVLGVCFFTLGQFPNAGPSALAIMFVKDLCYWILVHRISAHIQADTPTSQMAGVASARVTVMVGILATGEILVGAWSGIVPIEVEASLRALVGMSVGFCLLARKLKKVVLSDRPAF